MSKSQLFAIPSMLLALVLLLGAGESMAYGWGGYYGYGGIGGVYRSLDYPTERRVPYFAAHPPVYYSFPVPRTYGYSPFAYPPSARTPEWVSSEPLEIVNPHVEGASNSTKKNKTTSHDRTISNKAELQVFAPGPLVIENPFCKTEADGEFH